MTLVTVSLTMLVVMGLGAAAMTAASGDLNLAAHDDRSKRAYAAAEAGLHDYLFHLSQNNGYWALCTDVPPPARISDAWSGVGDDPRRWRRLSGTDAEYAIELLPAPGQPRCDSNNAQASMINAQGMFRIRTTGRVPTANGGYAKRSIVAAFRRRGFIDFLYYTDFETTDPSWYEVVSGGRPTRINQSNAHPTFLEWASASCARYYRPTVSGGNDGRGSQSWSGQIQWNPGGSWSSWPSRGSQPCTEIQFAHGDVVNGPLHTNDEIMVCGSPTFGRNAQDRIEVSAPPRGGFSGYRAASGCSANPNFEGTFTANSPILAMPPTNTKLKTVAEPAYTFTGETEIELTGSGLVITNAAAGLDKAMRAYPPNGVIYVQNGDCGQTTRPLAPLDNPEGCGDAHIHGTYGSDLTIATENDILVTDDVRMSNDRMLGLIANNYVRVHHTIRNLSVGSGGSSCTNNDSPTNVEIDAAILSLTRSFTVDYYFCGSPLGDLTVHGAIAQKYRGPVGQGSSGGGISNGYLKDYNYDDRLAYRSPPHFLDPVQSAWRLARQTEQTPAR